MTKAVSTADIEIAVMEWLGIRRNLVVPNVHWGAGLRHECDILSLTASGYATEIEIKTSKRDLLRDKDKGHGHVSKKIKYLYFAVPLKLEVLALSEIPERAGLLVVDRNRRGVLAVDRVRKARAQKSVKWSEDDRYSLARLGALRILGLKRKLRKCGVERRQLRDLVKKEGSMSTLKAQTRKR